MTRQSKRRFVRVNAFRGVYSDKGVYLAGAFWGRRCVHGHERPCSARAARPRPSVAAHGALAVSALRRHAKLVPLDHAAGTDRAPDSVRPDLRPSCILRDGTQLASAVIRTYALAEDVPLYAELFARAVKNDSGPRQGSR